MSEQKPRRRKTTIPSPNPLEEQGFTTGQEVVAESLAPQLGTDSKALIRGGFDMRRLSVFSEQMQTCLAYFGWRGGGQKYKVKQIVEVEDVDIAGNPIIRKEEALVEKTRKGVGFWAHIVDWYLNTSPSIEGRGRRQIIEMQRATTPGQRQLPPEEEPGWWSRNLTDRGWKKKQEQY